jgi:ParB family chromosome partitioning protein
MEPMIRDVRLDDVRIDKLNVRQHGAERDIPELATSIKTVGLLQPVVLRGSYEDGPPWELIVGQRRYLAYKHLRRRTIPAVFLGVVDDTEAVIRSLVENVVRVELDHPDAERAVTLLYTQLGRDDRKVAAATGLSLTMVRRYLDVHERASPKVRKMLDRGKVKPIDVQRSLRAVRGNIDTADRMLEIMEKEGLSGNERARVAQYGDLHRHADRMKPEEIVRQALRPRVEARILVSLPSTVRTALGNAMEKLSMDEEEVALRALTEWLTDQGFMDA